MSRSSELRAKHRRIFLLSLGAAVLLHVLAFVFWPTMQVDRTFEARPLTEAEAMPEANPTFVEVLFGPPDILDAEGRLVREERSLEADHVLPLPPECAVAGRAPRLPAVGRVRLRVGFSGRATVVDLAESTGSECGDAVVASVADALQYEWLPDDRYPAPVDLIQPITLRETSP